MLFKNVAGQKVPVYAHDTNADAPKTGDAANITARISKDGAAVAQTNDVTPAELSATLAKGVYLFDLTQAETNCDLLILSAASSTADVQIEPVIIYTQGGAVPKATPGAAGGLPTVDANNRVAGLVGTINTLDELDTAQDTQHDATQTAVGDVPTVAEFEARTLPTASYATAANQGTIAGYVDCLPATLDGSTFTNLPAVALTSGERDALVAAIEGELADDATGEAIKQAVVDKLLENLPDLDDLTLAAIGNASRDAILDRLLSGNHDIAGTVGKLLQHLDAAITSRHASGAAVAKSPATVDWDADVSNKPTIGTSTLTAEQVWAHATRTLSAFTFEVTASALTSTALAQFAADDTGETTAAAGSVAKLAQGTGASLTKEEISTQVNTDLTSSHGGGSWQTSGDAGSGANTVTITVDDGSDPLENAKVRVQSGAENYLAQTDVDGEVVFALDNATWSVAVTKAGYTFTPTTLAVAADVNQTYSMAAVSITPSDPGQVTGYFYCYDENGVIEEDVEVNLQTYRPASGSYGVVHDTTVRTQTSGATGLVEFTGLFPGTTYKLRRGDVAPWQEITIPADADDPYELDSIAGRP